MSVERDHPAPRERDEATTGQFHRATHRAHPLGNPLRGAEVGPQGEGRPAPGAHRPHGIRGRPDVAVLHRDPVGPCGVGRGSHGWREGTARPEQHDGSVCLRARGQPGKRRDRPGIRPVHDDQARRCVNALGRAGTDPNHRAHTEPVQLCGQTRPSDEHREGVGGGQFGRGRDIGVGTRHDDDTGAVEQDTRGGQRLLVGGGVDVDDTGTLVGGDHEGRGAGIRVAIIAAAAAVRRAGRRRGGDRADDEHGGRAQSGAAGEGLVHWGGSRWGQGGPTTLTRLAAVSAVVPTRDRGNPF